MRLLHEVVNRRPHSGLVDDVLFTLERIRQLVDFEVQTRQRASNRQDVPNVKGWAGFHGVNGAAKGAKRFLGMPDDLVAEIGLSVVVLQL